MSRVSFATNRELARRAGSKGGKAVPAAKRTFRSVPGAARKAALIGAAIRKHRARAAAYAASSAVLDDTGGFP